MDFNFKNKTGQTILILLIIMYLLLGFRVPEPIASLIDTNIGKLVVVMVAILLFVTVNNPILGVLGLFVAYHLIRGSSVTTGNYALSNYLPTEEKKMSQFSALNQFPYTLEQEIVKKMAPFNKPESMFGLNSTNKSSYHPLVDNNYDAAMIHN